MILSTLKSNIKALAVCTGFFSLAACKEHSISKGGLVPEVDNINTFAKSTEDFTIKFTNGLTDSVITSNFAFSQDPASSGAVNAIGIGAYIDPFFGEQKAIAQFQLTPYSGNFKFEEGSTLDSAVLVLPFTFGSTTGTVYGDTSSTAKWNVYKTGGTLAKNTTYYSSQQTAFGTLIGTSSFNYQQFKDSSRQIIAATSDTTRAQLRIKLSSSFAQEMFNADTSVYKNTTAFQAFFNGISIAADASVPQNLLAYFLLGTTSTSESKNLTAARIEFHSHKADTNYISSLVMRSSVCAYYTSLIHKLSGYPANNMLGRNTDSILVQGQPGFKTDVNIEGLSQIPLSVVNKAEILITVQGAGTSPSILDFLKAPSVLIPVIVDENGSEQPLFERLDNSGSTNAAGIYMVNPYADSTTVGGVRYQRYKINIPRTVQQYIIEGKDKLTIRLKGTNYVPGTTRLLAKGITGTDPNTKFQFNIIYTKR